MEGPVKADFRLARRATTLGGVDIAAGHERSICSTVRPTGIREHFEDPDEFRVDRPNLREHVAFGRGIHSCPGGPLARVEGRISIERLLARMRDIRISDEHHGPPGDRRYDYVPTYILRGISALHVVAMPAEHTVA